MLALISACGGNSLQNNDPLSNYRNDEWSMEQYFQAKIKIDHNVLKPNDSLYLEGLRKEALNSDKFSLIVTIQKHLSSPAYSRGFIERKIISGYLQSTY